jgi:23S rRNA (cytidine1920-2'-O)/16S rRNA (cytidine1409-2'-O)-methyltransferase
MAKFTDGPFVSRGGDKLYAALTEFQVDVTGLVCADFGANVGGFTDCLLRLGAAKVYALDTGYGELAWKLRKDPRVVVMERTNALYEPPPEPVGLVVIDVAFTPQRLSVPAAWKWLTPGGRIVSLLKPHYELEKLQRKAQTQPMDLPAAQAIGDRVRAELEQMGYPVRQMIQSPLKGKGGNYEFFLLLERPAS